MNDRVPTVPLTPPPWWVLPSQAAARTNPSLRPPTPALRVCASPASTERAWTRMSLAAIRSRSSVTPHCVQVQGLTSRRFFPESNPHTEHNWDDGNHRADLHELPLVPDRLSSSSRTRIAQQHQHGLRQPGPGQTDTHRSSRYTPWLSRVSRSASRGAVNGSSRPATGLFKARRWSLRLLLMAAVSLLAGVVCSIWSTFNLMVTNEVTSVQPNGSVNLSERAGLGYVRDDPGQQRGQVTSSGSVADVLVDPVCARRSPGRNWAGLQHCQPLAEPLGVP
jgi:hypothetical protein